MSVDAAVKAPAKQVYRKIYVKRVLPAGGYEPEWFEITSYVMSWGTLKESYGDNLYVGEYEIDSLQVTFDNHRAKFNAETDPNSIFFSYATRVGTRFKVEIGFIVDEQEFLARSFYGISYSEPKVYGSGEIKYEIASTLKVFQLFPAKGISEQNKFTHEHMTRLVQKTQNGVRIFDKYFEGTTDAQRYLIQTGVEKFLIIIGDEWTVWDKIKQLSFYENFYPKITTDGNFQWVDRSATGPVVWKFNGAGSFDNEYGINIVSIEQQLGVDRTYSRVTIKYGANFADTEVREIAWTPNDGSVPDLYGVRLFEYEATPGELNSSDAGSIAQRILTATATPKNIYKIETTFIPQLNLNDVVELNYRGAITGQGFILGLSILGGPDLLGGPQGSINLEGKICKISGIEIDLDTFVCNFELTEN